MTAHTEQMHIHIQKFEDAITNMAWGIAEQIFDEQKKRLVSGLNNVVIKASKKPANTAEVTKQLEKRPFRVMQACRLLDSRNGTWDRGSGVYKVVGPGKEPETFDLENATTGKKINSTLRTLASRWKHTP